jgi:glycosyltransferase involved in cell wall biosynthesis
MRVVHNGISVEHFAKRPMAVRAIRDEFCMDVTRPIVLAVGRLVAEKDYPNLLRAISATPGLKSARVFVAGEGPLHSDLRDLATKLGIVDRVVFLGIRRDIVELMSAANVFVLPSRSEGYGLVVAEAMACECVVVATDSGGVREVVGDAGFVTPPGDSNALGELLASALSLPPAFATELGKRARLRIAAHYSLDSMLDEWIEVYTA